MIVSHCCIRDMLTIFLLFGVMVVKHLIPFVQLLNAQHPSIRFTVEHSDTLTHIINFLDLTISVSNCTSDWELFIKSSHSGVHLSYMSSISLSTKRVVAANQY